VSQRIYDLIYPADTRPWTKALLAVLLLLLGTALSAQDQSRGELEQQRKRLLSEIEQTTSELKNTRRDKKKVLNTYLSLEKQIRQRQELLRTLQEEIKLTQQSIDRTNEVLTSLEADVARLKEEYSLMLRVAFRHKMNQSYMLFLFSANSLNDAFRRWQYIRQYDRYRKQQARLIYETQQMLGRKAQQLNERKSEKEDLLASSQTQQHRLNNELADKDALITELKSSERTLVAELDQQQKAHQKLNSLIEEVIRAEMLAKRKRARDPESLQENAEATRVSMSLSQRFAQRKGQLPWPVQGGDIIKPYGVFYHPKYKQVKMTNNGIDIRTDRGATVRSIFEGTVAGTQFIPGYQNTIIIKHGSFYSVYSNLERIYVKRGENINAEQKIGKLGTQQPELHFEIWQEKNRMNPSNWVRP